MTASWKPIVAVFALMFVVSGCATGGTTQAPPSQPRSAGSSKEPALVKIDAFQAERLQRIMTPLLAAMNHPLSPKQVRIGVMDDSHINAANAGGGEFYVTTGLLTKANDDQLRGVLAHETAHADLGHVTKLQTLGAGLNIGMVILDQIIPGSGALTPLAGQLIANAYTRKEEYAADAHGVEILRRAGFDGKTMMVNTLTWLTQTEGASGGGFFATHPGTADRIQAVQNMK
jgi:predicted Zn-dependent protease